MNSSTSQITHGKSPKITYLFEILLRNTFRNIIWIIHHCTGVQRRHHLNTHPVALTQDFSLSRLEMTTPVQHGHGCPWSGPRIPGSILTQNSTCAPTPTSTACQGTQSQRGNQNRMGSSSQQLPGAVEEEVWGSLEDGAPQFGSMKSRVEARAPRAFNQSWIPSWLHQWLPPTWPVLEFCPAKPWSIDSSKAPWLPPHPPPAWAPGQVSSHLRGSGPSWLPRKAHSSPLGSSSGWAEREESTA